MPLVRALDAREYHQRLPNPAGVSDEGGRRARSGDPRFGAQLGKPAGVEAGFGGLFEPVGELGDVA